MPDTAEPRRAQQILVVEDEPLIRLMAVDMLNILGFGVLEAGSGAEALAVAAEYSYGIDALMIDLGLPDQRGEDVVRQVAFGRPGLPVIITSGADASAGRALDGFGVVAFLEKPYYFKYLEMSVALLPRSV